MAGDNTQKIKDKFNFWLMVRFFFFLCAAHNLRAAKALQKKQPAA